jgi:hypothetical protein
MSRAAARPFVRRAHANEDFLTLDFHIASIHHGQSDKEQGCPLYALST